jgi:quinol monooxygenase YgiN
LFTAVAQSKRRRAHGSAPVTNRLGDGTYDTPATFLKHEKSNAICNPFADKASDIVKRSYIMVKLAIWATVQAKAGKENQVESFLKSAQQLAEAEPKTVSWYALNLGGGRFGIFDTFQDESGREAHLNGEIAKALMANAKELLSGDPQIHKIEILAAKAA